MHVSRFYIELLRVSKFFFLFALENGDQVLTRGERT